MRIKHRGLLSVSKFKLIKSQTSNFYTQHYKIITTGQTKPCISSHKLSNGTCIINYRHKINILSNEWRTSVPQDRLVGIVCILSESMLGGLAPPATALAYAAANLLAAIEG
jgi:hypothetical protein